MKEVEILFDWVDMASLIGGATFLTLLVYGVTQL